MKHYVEIKADGKKMGLVPKTQRKIITALKNLCGIKMKTLTEDQVQVPPKTRAKKPKQQEAFSETTYMAKPSPRD